MLRTCNNCDAKCKGKMNAIEGCSDHRHIISRVPFRLLVSKVSFTNFGPEYEGNKDRVLPFLSKY